MKKQFKSEIRHLSLSVMIYGALTGLTVGTVITFYKIIAEFLKNQSRKIYATAESKPILIPIILAAAGILGLIASLIQKWAPETKGGGIPRAEGILRGLLTFRWLRTFIGEIVNSFITFFVGVPLGSEGPAVLIGTTVGSCMPQKFLNRYNMTGGASAGFAVATNAPLSGILFSIEEAHHRISPMILLNAMSSVVFAMTTSSLWCYLLKLPVGPMFEIGEMIESLTGKDLWIAIAVGFAVAFSSMGFNRLVFHIGSLYHGKLKRMPQWLRLLIVFLLTATIGLLRFGDFHGVDALYGSIHLIESIALNEKTLTVLLIILVIRFLMISFSTGSGATGGVFVPMLSIGAIIGGILGEIFEAWGMSPSLYGTVIMMTMVAFMGTSTRTPLTALVFVLESTWSFSNLLYMAVALFIGYNLSELFKAQPLYDVLLDHMVKKQNEGKVRRIVNFTMVVKPNAPAVNKTVKDILWPANIKVGEIVDHGNVRLDEDGEKRMHVGTMMQIMAQTYDETRTKEELETILGKQDTELIETDGTWE